MEEEGGEGMDIHCCVDEWALVEHVSLGEKQAIWQGLLAGGSVSALNPHAHFQCLPTSD